MQYVFGTDRYGYGSGTRAGSRATDGATAADIGCCIQTATEIGERKEALTKTFCLGPVLTELSDSLDRETRPIIQRDSAVNRRVIGSNLTRGAERNSITNSGPYWLRPGVRNPSKMVSFEKGTLFGRQRHPRALPALQSPLGLIRRGCRPEC